MERFAIKIDKNLRANLYKICRLCGIDNPDKIKILDETAIVNLDEGEPELWKKVLDCVGLLISKDDKMPQFMCTLCVDKINDFYEFREMCYATDIQTRKLLGIKDEPKQKIGTLDPPSFELKKEKEIKQPVQVITPQRPFRKRRTADMEICSALNDIKTDETGDVKPLDDSPVLNGPKKKRLKMSPNVVEIKPAPPLKSRTALGPAKRRLKLEPVVREKRDLRTLIASRVPKKDSKTEIKPIEERKPLSLQIQKRKKALELLKQRKLAKQVAVVKVEKLRRNNTDVKIKEETVPTRVHNSTPAPTQPKVKLKDKCTICKEAFINKVLLDKHLISNHAPSVVRYHCVQCNETLKKNMEIKNHNLWHKLSKTPFQCGNCSESSCSIYTYTKHIRDCGQVAYIEAHTPDWHCPECHGIFETTYLFNIHSCVSSMLICPGCDKPVKWKEDYFKHIPTCAAAVHRIPSYMTPHIQVKNEAELPASPIPQQSSTSATTPASRITPPLMDSNQCVVIPRNVSLREEAASPSSKSTGKKSNRITKKDLKRFDELLKSTMTTLVSIKKEPNLGEGGDELENPSSPSNNAAGDAESPPGSPSPMGNDDFHGHESDNDNATEPVSSQRIKQEIIDEGYRDLYNNVEVNIKREVVLNENKSPTTDSLKKKLDCPEEQLEPAPVKPVLKLKITKEHGTLNSILVDSTKIAKKKKKKKRKEEKHKSSEKTSTNRPRSESSTQEARSNQNSPSIPAQKPVEQEPTMPLPEIIHIKQEITESEEKENIEQISSNPIQSTPSIVAATSGSLQISCVSEGVTFNAFDEGTDSEEQMHGEDDMIVDADEDEEIDVKPRLEDLVPMLKIASVTSGEAVNIAPVKVKARKRRRLSHSIKTPQIVSISSGSEALALHLECERSMEQADNPPEKVDSNKNVFDYSQVKVKEEILDPTYDTPDTHMQEPRTEIEKESAVDSGSNVGVEPSTDELNTDGDPTMDGEQNVDKELKANEEVNIKADTESTINEEPKVTDEPSNIDKEQKDDAVPESVADAEPTASQASNPNSETESQSAEGAYIAAIDFDNLNIKQEKEYIDDGLENERESSTSPSGSSSESEDDTTESEREYRDLPSENEDMASLGLQIATVRSEFNCRITEVKTDSKMDVDEDPEYKTAPQLTGKVASLDVAESKNEDPNDVSTLIHEEIHKEPEVRMEGCSSKDGHDLAKPLLMTGSDVAFSNTPADENKQKSNDLAKSQAMELDPQPSTSSVASSKDGKTLLTPELDCRPSTSIAGFSSATLDQIKQIPADLAASLLTPELDNKPSTSSAGLSSASLDQIKQIPADLAASLLASKLDHQSSTSSSGFTSASLKENKQNPADLVASLLTPELDNKPSTSSAGLSSASLDQIKQIPADLAASLLASKFDHQSSRSSAGFNSASLKENKQNPADLAASLLTPELDNKPSTSSAGLSSASLDQIKQIPADLAASLLASKFDHQSSRSSAGFNSASLKENKQNPADLAASLLTPELDNKPSTSSAGLSSASLDQIKQIPADLAASLLTPELDNKSSTSSTGLSSTSLDRIKQIPADLAASLLAPESDHQPSTSSAGLSSASLDQIKQIPADLAASLLTPELDHQPSTSSAAISTSKDVNNSSELAKSMESDHKPSTPIDETGQHPRDLAKPLLKPELDPQPSPLCPAFNTPSKDGNYQNKNDLIEPLLMTELDHKQSRSNTPLSSMTKDGKDPSDLAKSLIMELDHQPSTLCPTFNLTSKNENVSSDLTESLAMRLDSQPSTSSTAFSSTSKGGNDPSDLVKPIMMDLDHQTSTSISASDQNSSDLAESQLEPELSRQTLVVSPAFSSTSKDGNCQNTRDLVESLLMTDLGQQPLSSSAALHSTTRDESAGMNSTEETRKAVGNESEVPTHPAQSSEALEQEEMASPKEYNSPGNIGEIPVSHDDCEMPSFDDIPAATIATVEPNKTDPIQTFIKNDIPSLEECVSSNTTPASNSTYINEPQTTSQVNVAINLPDSLETNKLSMDPVVSLQADTNTSAISTLSSSASFSDMSQCSDGFGSNDIDPVVREIDRLINTIDDDKFISTHFDPHRHSESNAAFVVPSAEAVPTIIADLPIPTKTTETTETRKQDTITACSPSKSSSLNIADPYTTAHCFAQSIMHLPITPASTESTSYIPAYSHSTYFGSSMNLNEICTTTPAIPSVSEFHTVLHTPVATQLHHPTPSTSHSPSNDPDLSIPILSEEVQNLLNEDTVAANTFERSLLQASCSSSSGIYSPPAPAAVLVPNFRDLENVNEIAENNNNANIERELQDELGNVLAAAIANRSPDDQVDDDNVMNENRANFDLA